MCVGLSGVGGGKMAWRAEGDQPLVRCMDVVLCALYMTAQGAPRPVREAESARVRKTLTHSGWRLPAVRKARVHGLLALEKEENTPVLSLFASGLLAC